MTQPLPPQAFGPVPPRRRWGRSVLLVLLAGIGALGWHIYTGQRAIHQLREAGFVMESQDWLGPRVWAAARTDWRLVFDFEIWESPPTKWNLDSAKAGELRNLDAVAPALRRVNPGTLSLSDSAALQNVDGLKGLTGLRTLDLSECDALENVDGLKGLTGLQSLDLHLCKALENVDGLKGLTGLQELDLRYCDALQNVNVLKGLTGLQSLDLIRGHALQDLEVLKGLTGLQSLNLSDCTALQNVDGLKALTGLNTLYLSGCTSLQSVDGLKGLTRLLPLDLRGCDKIPASALRELRVALPKTHITFPDGSKLPPP